MSRLYTGKGDDGTTGLLFGGRVGQGLGPAPGRGRRRRGPGRHRRRPPVCEPDGDLDHQLTQVVPRPVGAHGRAGHAAREPPQAGRRADPGDGRHGPGRRGHGRRPRRSGSRRPPTSSCPARRRWPPSSTWPAPSSPAEREAVAATADGSARAGLPEPAVVAALGAGPLGRGRAPAQPRRPARRHGRDRPVRVLRAMDLGLAGRTAAVAGASSGLGLASARALAAEGARVASAAATGRASRPPPPASTAPSRSSPTCRPSRAPPASSRRPPRRWARSTSSCPTPAGRRPAPSPRRPSRRTSRRSS